jgi:PCI domain
MRNIRNLTSTYLTLSLEDIAQSACVQSIEEAEKLILKMVNIGDIKAVVDQQTRMVRFSSMDVSTTRSADKLRENEKALIGLERHIRETLQLSERLRDVQSRLLSSEEYLSKPSGKGLRVGGGIGIGMGMEIGGMGTMAQDSVGWVVNDSGFSNP